MEQKTEMSLVIIKIKVKNDGEMLFALKLVN
jgi:hypothetical protein